MRDQGSYFRDLALEVAVVQWRLVLGEYGQGGGIAHLLCPGEKIVLEEKSDTAHRDREEFKQAL